MVFLNPLFKGEIRSLSGLDVLRPSIIGLRSSYEPFVCLGFPRSNFIWEQVVGYGSFLVLPTYLGNIHKAWMEIIYGGFVYSKFQKTFIEQSVRHVE